MFLQAAGAFRASKYHGQRPGVSCCSPDRDNIAPVPCWALKEALGPSCTLQESSMPSCPASRGCLPHGSASRQGQPSNPHTSTGSAEFILICTGSPGYPPWFSRRRVGSTYASFSPSQLPSTSGRGSGWKLEARTSPGSTDLQEACLFSALTEEAQVKTVLSLL